MGSSAATRNYISGTNESTEVVLDVPIGGDKYLCFGGQLWEEDVFSNDSFGEVQHGNRQMLLDLMTLEHWFQTQDGSNRAQVAIRLEEL